MGPSPLPGISQPHPAEEIGRVRLLLDTDVVSQVGEPAAERSVLRRRAGTAAADTFISAITVRGLWYGCERMRLERSILASAVEARIRTILDAPTPPRHPRRRARRPHLGRHAGAVQRARGRHRPAVTATVHGLTVVTRNLAHLRGRGVPLLDAFRLPSAT